MTSVKANAVPPTAVEVNAVPTLQASNEATNSPIQAKAPVLVPAVNTRSASRSEYWMLGVLVHFWHCLNILDGHDTYNSEIMD